MSFSRDIADYPEGIVLAVDKPYRWTSADVIRKLKYAAIKHFGKKNLKVGHAGTLDPLATGVLLVCIGNACKRAQELQDHDKEYIARIRFGATTPSYDLEKEVDRRFPYEHITADAVRAALPAFLGEQEQVAPLFSAKSVDGVRAYELARKLYRAGKTEAIDAAGSPNRRSATPPIRSVLRTALGPSLLHGRGWPWVRRPLYPPPHRPASTWQTLRAWGCRRPPSASRAPRARTSAPSPATWERRWDPGRT